MYSRRGARGHRGQIDAVELLEDVFEFVRDEQHPITDRAERTFRFDLAVRAGSA